MLSLPVQKSGFTDKTIEVQRFDLTKTSAGNVVNDQFCHDPDLDHKFEINMNNTWNYY